MQSLITPAGSRCGAAAGAGPAASEMPEAGRNIPLLKQNIMPEPVRTRCKCKCRALMGKSCLPNVYNKDGREPKKPKLRVPCSMKESRAACFDVYYYGDYAKACCIVFDTEPDELIVSQYGEHVKPVSDYVPGEFYKRELPCILKVYEMVREEPGLLIVDGFVLLGEGKRGLGGHLFEALEGRIPVIGVAKTLFKGSNNYGEVYRGHSNKPLFVSSMGVDLNSAAALIRKLKGKNRLPDMLKRVDELTRSERGQTR